MKTGQVKTNQLTSYTANERKQAEANEKASKPAASGNTEKLVKPPSKKIRLDKTVINNPEAVKEMIGDSIQWREMKFYQRTEGGQLYIDIVDKNTGNVLRTIPDTKFAEIAEKFKQLSGLTIDISG